MVICVKWKHHTNAEMRVKGSVTMMMIVKLMIVMMMMIQLSSANLPSLIKLTTTSVIERPERAALEPPTVTSLRPPDRNKSGRGISVVVQSEQSGGHIPPVVASRSPSSSSSSKNFNSRYIHVYSQKSQPSPPVATSSSSSRSKNSGGSTERRSLLDAHQTLPAPTPYLVNGTSALTPQFPPASYIPPPQYSYGASGYSPVARSYPRHHGVYEDRLAQVPETPYMQGIPKRGNLPASGGGVWDEASHPSRGGLWGNSRRQPAYPHDPHRIYGHSITEEDGSRTDTFGHRISEDLSHLNSEYPPHGSNSRRSRVQHPGQSATDEFYYPPTAGAYYPHEDFPVTDNENYHNQNGFRGQRTFSSHPSRDSNTETSHSRYGNHPASYGSNSRTGQVHMAKVHHTKIDAEDEFGQNSSISKLHPDVSPSDDNSRRPLTLYEIWQMKNMSNWEEFVEFLEERGLTVKQVLNYINEGATKQELLDFFDRLDSTKMVNDPTEESTPEEKRKNRRRGRNKKRGRKNRDKNKRRRGRKGKKNTTPDFVYTTVILPIDISKNESFSQLTPPEPTSRVTDTTSVSMTTMHNDTLPNQFTREEPFNSDIQFQSTETSFTNLSSNSTWSAETTFHSQPPIITFPQENTTAKNTQIIAATLKPVSPEETTVLPQPTFSQTSVSRHPAVMSWPKPVKESPTTPTTVTSTKPISVPLTTQEAPTPSAELIEPRVTLSELDKSVKATLSPTAEGPRTSSLTLPPTSKPSQVSIVSFTVMEVPTHDSEETIAEGIAPITKRQNRRKLHKKTHQSHPKRIYSPPKLYPVVTPKKMENEMVVRTPYAREDNLDNYKFPVKGFMIITGIMGALAVFTIVVLISYAIIKCSKPPVVNNYQVSEQKPATQQQ